MQMGKMGAGVGRMGNVNLGFLILVNRAFHFKFNEGITSSGGTVSQWDDKSGNDRHLKQATATNQPSLEADGSILFDGVDNFLKCDAFTFNQPETIYLLGKQVTWVGNTRFFDGNTFNTGVLYQASSSPNIDLFAGNDFTGQNGDLAVDTYGVVSIVFNGSSSLLQVNNETPHGPDNAGSNNMGGFTLGATGSDANFGNIQCKEIIGYSQAHGASERARVIRYLAGVGGLDI